MEIGSEFWSVPTVDRENRVFPAAVHWYQSGRSALRAIVSLLNARTAALPAWCCHTMIQPFLDAGIEVKFYPVRRGPEGLIQELNTDCDVLFVMDYFGYSSSLPDLTGFRGVVIRDVTHSLFSRRYGDADYQFGSLRKWCGVWTGGYAWAGDGSPLPNGEQADPEYTALRRSAMEHKQRYLSGMARTDKAYLATFAQAEDLLDKPGIRSAALRDVKAAMHLDVPAMRDQRRRNAAVLREALQDWLIFPEMGTDDCPLFVPVAVPGGRRDDLRRALIRQDIYCPVHWPLSEVHSPDPDTAAIYESELSLVCDQRYTEEDMERVAEAVRRSI